jgi:phosphatidylserine/phosphatidylglycerophosphate/cardiolipin synthase-like enzyme
MIPVEDATVVKGYTSPDYARDTFMEGLDSAKKSLMIHIYQVTDDEICDKILELFNKGVNVTMIVGSYIVSYVDYHKAQLCYQKLYNGGMKPGMIQKSYSKFSFSHQKYWIVDGTTVHLSTGNWSPSDFPEGSTFPPYKTSKASVNRDMLVVMESPKIVEIFSQVFQNDWIAGTPWQPK